MSQPVLVLIEASDCGHCRDLSRIWNSVTAEIKAVYPYLRFVKVATPSMRNPPDFNNLPQGLAFYTKWYPMILLVPGNLWDAAMNNIGSHNPIELKQGVQVMNASWSEGGNGLNFSSQYDIRKKEDFVRWLNSVMK